MSSFCLSQMPSINVWISSRGPSGTSDSPSSFCSKFGSAISYAAHFASFVPGGFGRKMDLPCSTRQLAHRFHSTMVMNSVVAGGISTVNAI